MSAMNTLREAAQIDLEDILAGQDWYDEDDLEFICERIERVGIWKGGAA